MKIPNCLLIPLCFALSSLAADPLIPFGSTWRYLDNGSDQGTAWRTPAFNDASWASGPGQLGYGDGDEATVVAYSGGASTRNATTYFRKTWTITNPADYASIQLTLLYDDAAAVYLNGIEVARTANLITNALYTTYALWPTPKDNSIGQWILSPALLVTGTNTLAVEIHQASPNSSDISFDLELAPEIPPGAVTRGPYLHMNHQSGITIRWRTGMATNSVVRIGTAPGLSSAAVTNLTPTTEHEVNLTGLQPDTRYFYTIGSLTEVLAGGDTNHFFMTAPVSGTDRPLHIWALGDCGTANSDQRAVRDAYYQSSEYRFNDIMLLLGDNAYGNGLDEEYQAALFDMFPTLLRQTSLWSCLGNHDTAQAEHGFYAAPYFDMFSFPTDAECGGTPSGTERYFSWDFGNVHLISIDTQTTDATLRTNMLTWLENDLAATTRRWIIACWHQPPYTKGSHDSDIEEQLIWARENLLPLLEASGVDLVLGGHSHSYERSRFIDGFYATPTLADSGTTIDNGDGQVHGDGAYGKDYGGHRGAVYAVAGSSGKLSGGPLDHPVMFRSLNQLGSMIISIDGNRLDAKFINHLGVIEDQFRIEKGPLVTLSTLIPDAAEYGPVTGKISVARSGSTTNPLNVQLEISGTAPETRYAPVTIPVTIPSGVTSQVVNIIPLPNASVQGTQTVVLSGVPNVAYRLSASTNATVSISDTPPDAPPIANWNLAQFGADGNNPNVTGNDVDLDGDGLPNLLEYALVHDPAVTNIPIAAGMVSNQWIILFRHDTTRTDVNLELQLSDDLLQSGWTPVVRTLGGAPVETLNGATLIRETGGNPGTVEVRLPSNLPKAYIRWQASPIPL